MSYSGPVLSFIISVAELLLLLLLLILGLSLLEPRWTSPVQVVYKLENNGKGPPIFGIRSGILY